MIEIVEGKLSGDAMMPSDTPGAGQIDFRRMPDSCVLAKGG